MTFLRRIWDAARGYVVATHTVGKDLTKPRVKPTQYVFPRFYAHLKHLAAGLLVPVLLWMYLGWWWQGVAILYGLFLAFSLGWNVRRFGWSYFKPFQFLRLAGGLCVPAYYWLGPLGAVYLGAWAVAYALTLPWSD